LLRRLLNRGVDIEGPSKPDNSEQKHEHDRQDKRGFRDFGSLGSV
jgi:hypothetical protein